MLCALCMVAIYNAVLFVYFVSALLLCNRAKTDKYKHNK